MKEPSIVQNNCFTDWQKIEIKRQNSDVVTETGADTLGIVFLMTILMPIADFAGTFALPPVAAGVPLLLSQPLLQSPVLYKKTTVSFYCNNELGP